MARDVLAVLTALAIAGCSGTSPAPTQTALPGGVPTPLQPTSSAPAPSGPAPTTSAQPTHGTSGTPEPIDTFVPEPGEEEITDEMLNPPPEPLPEPELGTTDEIAEALFTPGDEEQAIVSMLAALGIGLYNVDGTAIRTGTEASDADLYLFEPEVRGLVAMLKAQSDGETWITFTDFHADLVEFGLEASPEELLQVYLDTYAEHPDTPMTRFVQAQAFLDVEAQIPPLGVWLLFVDGMIPPHAASAATAMVGPGPIAQNPAPNIGQAFGQLQQLLNSPQVQNQMNSARARAALTGAGITLEASDRAAHEGHGGPGDSITFTATVNAMQANSPFGGSPITPCAGGSLEGITVNWFHAGLEAHGTTSVDPADDTVTDSGGRTTMTFEAQPEEPDGVWRRGVQTTDVAGVKVLIHQADVAGALCPGVPVGRGTVASSGDPLNVRIRYHVPRALLVTLTNSYDIKLLNQGPGGANADIKGQDFFVGRLVEKPDGTWHGFFVGRTAGSGTGVFWAADRKCTSRWAAFQILEVFGEKRPARLPDEAIGTQNGDFVLEFFPAAPLQAQAGTRLCRAARYPGARYDFAPFNSSYIYSGIGLGIKLPPDPGGFRAYRETATAPNTQYGLNTGWEVDIKYLKPPP